jgi:hypothetical protein
MHFLRAYIASIVILASWCMHPLASIMIIALCHMHHFSNAWNPPFSCCTIISIIHLNSASRSWSYIEHCILSGAFYHYSLIASVYIGMFYNQHRYTLSKNVSNINLLRYPHLLSLSLVINVTDIYRPHVVILAL